MLDVGIIALGEALNELVGAGLTAGLHQFLVGGVGVAPAQVLFNGAGEQGVLLQHHGHLIPEDIQVILPHIHAAHLQAALGHIVQPGNQLHQSGLGRAGAPQDSNGGAGGDVQVHFLQRPVLGLLGVAEGDIFKVDGAVGHLGDGVFCRGGEGGFLAEQLTAPLHGGAAHGEHHKHHGQHHQAGENLGGVGEHGAELTGGEPHGQVVSGGHHQMGADPGDGDPTAVDAQLHNGGAEGHNSLGLAEVCVDAAGDGGELLNLLILPDEALYNPDAVDIFLHHIVELVVGAEHPVENPEHPGHQHQKAADQHRQGHAVHKA